MNNNFKLTVKTLREKCSLDNKEVLFKTSQDRIRKKYILYQFKPESKNLHNTTVFKCQLRISNRLSVNRLLPFFPMW